MKALADQRARVARVRRVQHLRALGAEAAAEGKLGQLEGNAARLASLRESLTAAAGDSNGSVLAQAGELSMRLDEARRQLEGAIHSAREAAALRAVERLGAHIARESAERLQTRAVAEMHRIIEERMAAAFRPRAPKGRTE